MSTEPAHPARMSPDTAHPDAASPDTAGPQTIGAEAPPADVLAAFDVAPGARPERLTGGRGLTWAAGAVILRPADPDDETEWKSGVLESLPDRPGFTVPRPLRTVDGTWIADGWQALERVAGSADPARVRDVVAAGAAFHTALAEALDGQPPPRFIARGTGRWSRADRFAWGEPEPEPATGPEPTTAPEPTADPAPDIARLAEHPLLAALLDAMHPVDDPPAIVHGDLLGNVLFAPGHAPAIIDWAPYYRPLGYASAIAVADAVIWHGTPLQDLANTHGHLSWRQLMLRALAFRIATQHLARRWDAAFDARHVPVVAAALDLPE